MIPNISWEEARDIQSKIDNGTYQSKTKVNTTVPYWIYESKNAFLRTYDEEYWKRSKFDEYTETRSFEPSQLQECMFAESPDELWQLSDARQRDLTSDVVKAINTPSPNPIANLSLALDF